VGVGGLRTYISFTRASAINRHVDRVFDPLAPRPGAAITRVAWSALMILCSCNVLSDHDVRHAVAIAEDLPRNARQVYGCLGCSVECGRCASTVRTIIEEALGTCAKACQPGCPHSRAGRDVAETARTEI